jgi:hypothetical protein
MRGTTKLLVMSALFFLGAIGAAAQIKRPVETRNAALRYWQAFAELQDPPADKATTDLLEKTAAGDAAWDEAKLGPILDKNTDAVLAMQRATRLPECDWGLEYERGPQASIAYVPRARVLARLNTLYGMRLAAQAKTQQAIDTWLAGIRFSQHLTHGGGLIFSLIARMTLLSNFQALTQSARASGWSDAQRAEVRKVVSALPETGFDWSEALWYEQDPVDTFAKQVSQADNPRFYYEGVMGRPAPGIFNLPAASDIAAFHNLMGAAGAALRLPPDQAQDRLRALQESVKTLHPFYVEMIPSFTKINDARAEVKAARENLLHALVTK